MFSWSGGLTADRFLSEIEVGGLLTQSLQGLVYASLSLKRLREYLYYIRIGISNLVAMYRKKILRASYEHLKVVCRLFLCPGKNGPQMPLIFKGISGL